MSSKRHDGHDQKQLDLTVTPASNREQSKQSVLRLLRLERRIHKREEREKGEARNDAA